MATHLLGIDAGNTLIKAVLFDESGREIASEHRDGGSVQKGPGEVERDIGGLRRCVGEAVRACIAKADVPPSSIAAVGCAGHGNGIYILDAAGEPVIGIPSLDSRAAVLASTWKAEGREDAVFAIAGQKPWPAQTAVLMSWLCRNRPDLFARAASVMSCKDVVVHFLTGHVGTDHSDASGGGLLALPQRRYDPALMEALDLGGSMGLLPPLAEPTDVVGRVTRDAASATGLAEGTPVVAGLFDVVASSLGSGACSPGQASIVAGSWSINQIVSDVPRIDPDVFMLSTFRVDRWMQIEASATSAANLEWFLKEFMGDSLEARGRAATLGICNNLVSEVEPSTDLPLYHPYLYGSGIDADDRAGFFGMGSWHGRGHLLRAVMEGVAFGHRQHFDRLRASGAAPTSAVLSGGAARSDAWARIFADVLGMEIRVSDVAEAGAWGAAMAAGVGVGVFRDLETPASACGTKGSFDPDPVSSRIADERYGLFVEIGSLLRGRWKRNTHA